MKYTFSAVYADNSWLTYKGKVTYKPTSQKKKAYLVHASSSARDVDLQKGGLVGEQLLQEHGDEGHIERGHSDYEEIISGISIRCNDAQDSCGSIWMKLEINKF